MAEVPAGDVTGNTFQYQTPTPDRVVEYLTPGAELANEWQAFAERVGWGENPGGLFMVVVRETVRFWLSVT